MILKKIRLWQLLFVVVGLAATSGCENPDPTAPVALPDERPMPVWGMDFGKEPEATLDPMIAQAASSPGAVLFKNHCASCHGSTAAGTAMGAAINTELVLSKSDALLASTVMAGKGSMPSFKGRLSDAQIASILQWLRTQKGRAAPESGAVPTAVNKDAASGDAAKKEGAEKKKNAPQPQNSPKPTPTQPTSTRPGY